MRIRVDEIPEAGRQLHFRWDQDRLSAHLPPDDPFEMTLPRPAKVDLEVNRFPDYIRVRGTIRGALQVGCHRCLKPVELPLDEALEVLLVKATPAAEGEEGQEVELEEEDLEYEFFDGEVIDIGLLVSEQIFLSLPFKVLCSEECRGLCPGCGANLNDEPCQCAKSSKDSPFSVLEKLKTRLPS